VADEQSYMEEHIRANAELVIQALVESLVNFDRIHKVNKINPVLLIV